MSGLALSLIVFVSFTEKRQERKGEKLGRQLRRTGHTRVPSAKKYVREGWNNHPREVRPPVLSHTTTEEKDGL